MTHLLPNQTALVFGRKHGDYSNDWPDNAPIFDLSLHRSNPFLMARALLHHLNFVKQPNYIYLLKDFLKRNKVKAILCEYLDYSTRWIDMAEELGIRYYAHAHGYDISIRLKQPDWKEPYKRLNRADCIITINKVSKDRLIKFGIAENKVVVVPYGVTIPPIEPEYRSNKTVRCLAVGRMTGKKGPIYTLEAFRQALAQYPDLTLDYVGDGELMPAAVQFVDVFDLHENVNLLGSQDSDVVFDLMRKSDLFLQHSVTNPIDGDEEGLPVAILEAMAFGLPVISTRHAGIPEAVTDRETGILVGEGETNDMAKCIVKLAKSPNLRQAYGREGRRVVKQKFSWELERSRLLDIMDLDQ